MALTEQGIARAREIMAIGSSEWGNDFFESPYFKKIIYLGSNHPEFTKFVQGTQGGKDFYEKWQGLVKLLSVEYAESFAELRKATSMFLDEQERNNNIKID